MLGYLEESERSHPRLAVVPELDLDVAVGGDLAHRRLVVVAILMPERLALLANL